MTGSLLPLELFKMAKQITQQTFDDVVKENIQEFDMTVEDAIGDAVQQFESQVRIIGKTENVV